MSIILKEDDISKLHKDLEDDDTVGTIGTEIDSLGSVCEDENDNVQVFRINDDSFSLLSQHDLSYADFSHVVDDEDNSVCSFLTYSSNSVCSFLTYSTNSVCSFLTYSTIRTESESNNSLNSKIETNSGILSGTIHITQIMKENMTTNFDTQREKLIETQKREETISRIEELQRRKRSMEEQHTSSIISSNIKINEKIYQDEFDCSILEKSIDASMKRMLATAAICIPLFPFICGVLAA